MPTDIPEIEPTCNVMDEIRFSIATLLASCESLVRNGVQVAAAEAYTCIEIARKGPHDLSVALPRLRLDGKPEENAKTAAAKVRDCPHPTLSCNP